MLVEQSNAFTRGGLASKPVCIAGLISSHESSFVDAASATTASARDASHFMNTICPDIGLESGFPLPHTSRTAKGDTRNERQYVRGEKYPLQAVGI